MITNFHRTWVQYPPPRPGFKAHLKTVVDKWGGVTKLAKETGIPQPTISRFFSSSSMPRRTTLYKIAEAFNLSEEEIITDWAA